LKVIIDSTERFVIDNMGWVDKAALWFLDLSTGAVRQVPLGTGDYLTLMGGERDLFVAVRRESVSLLEATVHSAASPPDVLARLRIEQGRATFSGRADLWASVPRVFVADHSRFANVVRPLLFLVDQRRGTVDFQELPWYSDGYDLMYQGLLDPVPVPESDLLLMPIQRDSEPVIYDLTERRKVGTMKLADRHGNPTLRFRRTASELWADDYDTILRLDIKSWRVRDALRLQENIVTIVQGRESRGGAFIGQYCFDLDEVHCAVARPFSGDVVVLDTESFRQARRVPTGSQPLRVALLRDGRIIARDWKTGKLLRAQADE
jgi:hypothetical protein